MPFTIAPKILLSSEGNEPEVKASAPGFNLDTDALIPLKKAGVSDAISAAMMDRLSE